LSNQSPKKAESKKKALNAYGRYSSLAIQIVIVVIVFAWLGMKLDEVMEAETPGWTAGLTGVGIISALYYLYVSVTKKDS
jgi:hypothetical protein